MLGPTFSSKLCEERLVGGLEPRVGTVVLGSAGPGPCWDLGSPIRVKNLEVVLRMKPSLRLFAHPTAHVVLGGV